MGLRLKTVPGPALTLLVFQGLFLTQACEGMGISRRAKSIDMPSGLKHLQLAVISLAPGCRITGEI